MNLGKVSDALTHLIGEAKNSDIQRTVTYLQYSVTVNIIRLCNSVYCIG
jgi:hypothetical protein